MRFETPSTKTNAFTCPHCGTFAHQMWYFGTAHFLANGLPPIEGPRVSALRLVDDSGYRTAILSNLFVSKCQSCSGVHIWHGEEMIYPASTPAPMVNPDTPEDIKADYEEARRILAASPRGAAAMLRLAIQKLCAHLGESGKNINDDIASMVRKGLDVRIQRALDVLRVVGNEAVHPGTIDLNDNTETAVSLFGFFNLIVEKMISEPLHVDNIYSQLPADKLRGIEKRDSQSGGK